MICNLQKRRCFFGVFRASQARSGRGACDTRDEERRGKITFNNFFCASLLRACRAFSSFRACLRKPAKREKNNVCSAGFIFCFYSGTPLILSPIGQKKLAVLTGDRINKGFFTRKCMAVLPGSQKSGRNNEVTVRRGFTVLASVYVKRVYSRKSQLRFQNLNLVLSFFTDPIQCVSVLKSKKGFCAFRNV